MPSTREQFNKVMPYVVTGYDIAAVCGVGLSAVSNWQRRYDDMPQPLMRIGNGALWAIDELDPWLRKRGYIPDWMNV